MAAAESPPTSCNACWPLVPLVAHCSSTLQPLLVRRALELLSRLAALWLPWQSCGAFQEHVCLPAHLTYTLHHLTTGEAGLKKLARAVDAAVCSVHNLLSDHLQPQLEQVAFR